MGCIKPYRLNNKGFTITEILVALLIFSVIAVPLTGALSHWLSDPGEKERLKAIFFAKGFVEETLHFRTALKAKEDLFKEKEYRVERPISGDSLKQVEIRVLKRDKELFSIKTLLYQKDSHA